MLNYYKILGVSPEADERDIKRAYRQLIKEHHPDRNPDKEAALRKTKLLNSAYHVLKDPVRRLEYDNLLSLRQEQQRSKESAEKQTDKTESTYVPDLKCDKCGKQDSTLRVSIFIWVVGLLFFSYKKGWAHILCSRCRIKYSLLFNLEVLFLGWWAIHAFFYSIEALIKNSKGGIQPPENNFSLLVAVGYLLYNQGRFNEAYKTIRQSLQFKKEPEVIEFLKYLKQYRTSSKRMLYSDRLFRVHPAWFNVPVICVVLFWFYSVFSSANWSSSRKYSSQFFAKAGTQVTSANNKSEFTEVANRYGIKVALFDSVVENCNTSISNISSYIRRTLPVVDITHRGNQTIYQYELNRELLDSYEMKRHADKIESLLQSVNTFPNIKSFRQAISADPRAQELRDYVESQSALLASAYFNARLLELSIPVVKSIYKTGEISKYHISELKKVGENPHVAKWLSSSTYSSAYKNLLYSLESYLQSQNRLKVFTIRLKALENTITKNKKRLEELKRQLNYYERKELIDAYNNLVDTNNSLIYTLQNQIDEYNSLLSRYESFTVSINVDDLHIDGAFNNCLDPAVFFLEFEYVDLHSGESKTETTTYKRK